MIRPRHMEKPSRVLLLAAVAETATGILLLLAPTLVVRVLFGTAVADVGFQRVAALGQHLFERGDGLGMASELAQAQADVAFDDRGRLVAIRLAELGECRLVVLCIIQTHAFGEVGLGGEIRPAVGLERRLGEAGRLGFTRFFGATRETVNVPGASLVKLAHVNDLVRVLAA